MSDSVESRRSGAPGSAYVSVMLGIAAVATLAWPPLPILLGALGLAAALHARSILRRDDVPAGTAPSLIGAILSVVGLLTVAPWVVGLVVLVTAPR